MQCIGPSGREDELNLDWNDEPNLKWNETYQNAI